MLAPNFFFRQFLTFLDQAYVVTNISSLRLRFHFKHKF